MWPGLALNSDQLPSASAGIKGLVVCLLVETCDESAFMKEDS